MRQLIRFFKNLWWYRSVLWNDYEGDWEPTLRILQRKLEKSLKVGFPYSYDHGRNCREISTCIALINRIREDDYIEIDIPGGDFMDGKIVYRPMQIRPSKPWEHSEYMIKQDMELLFKILNRKLRTWWD